jgi:general secretion pathway protein A
MYKVFFNLKRNPFEITPDPSFLFATRKHNEALASLYYGVRRHKGFVVMTGEVGTGKTLLIRCLLELLTRNQVGFAYIFNSRLNDMEFLRYVAGDFGLTASGKGKDELLLSISDYLVERHRKKLTTLLVVDEAHHLSAEVLEEIRLLTNLETPTQKLLQILLVGQPELNEKLDSTNLRQLKQRIALRCNLEALSEEETRAYIKRRLQLAGSNPEARIFSDAAAGAIYRHSRGIPRLINTVCENALIAGYAHQRAQIEPDIIDEVAADLRLGIVTSEEDDVSIEEGSEQLRSAANTLLQFHDFLQSARSKQTKPQVIIRRGIREHEPLI